MQRTEIHCGVCELGTLEEIILQGRRVSCTADRSQVQALRASRADRGAATLSFSSYIQGALSVCVTLRMRELQRHHGQQRRARNIAPQVPPHRARQPRQPACPPVRLHCSCAAAPSAADTLTAEQQSTWDTCRQHLLDLGVKDDVAANRILRQSFGWAGQAFWSSEKVRVGVQPAKQRQARNARTLEVGRVHRSRRCRLWNRWTR